jgi:endonuclease/exonuclease/phosphatase family metal-dependent hydrolase
MSDLKILTCNIRCSGADDGDDDWAHRRDWCAEVITSRSPSIICFQEMWRDQFDYLVAALPEFDSYGVADEPCTRRPMNTVFYRRDDFCAVSAGAYWLSEKPHVSGSRSWDSACVRLANWVRLEIRAPVGKEMRIVNTHLDHVGQEARERQAALIVEDSAAYPDDYPQILTGDMNCASGNRAIGIFQAGGWSDTYRAVFPGVDDPGHTFHGFSGADFESTVGKMDWVFSRGAVKPIDAEIITDSTDDRFPSDHYFVSATIELD